MCTLRRRTIFVLSGVTSSVGCMISRLRSLRWIAPRLIMLPLAYAGQRAIIALTRFDHFDSLPIGAFVNPTNRVLVARVAEALGLIKSVYPAAYQRIQRGFGSILILPVQSPGFWVPTRTCVLDETLVGERSEALIASALVHEAVHARVDLICTPPEVQKRIEPLCTAVEINLAKRLPRDQYPGRDTYLSYLQERYERERAATVRR